MRAVLAGGEAAGRVAHASRPSLPAPKGALPCMPLRCAHPWTHPAPLTRLPRAAADGEAAAEQWEPVISPLLLQSCWQQLEAAWAASGAVDSAALQRYASTGALAGSAAEDESGAQGGPATAAGMLGAFLQLHAVPPAGALQHTCGQVQEMLRGAQLRDAGDAASAAAAMLCATHRGLGLPAARALAAALLH